MICGLEQVPTSWRHPCHIPKSPLFAAGDWQPLYELANHQLGAQAQWWRAINRADFQPLLEDQVGEWFAPRRGGAACAPARDSGLSPLRGRARFSPPSAGAGEHLLRLWARPEHYGSHDLTLLHWALTTLQEYPHWPIQIALSTDHTSAVEMLDLYGFRPLRTLLTLRKQMK